jgi:hypothetical protein
MPDFTLRADQTRQSCSIPKVVSASSVNIQNFKSFILPQTTSLSKGLFPESIHLHRASLLQSSPASLSQGLCLQGPATTSVTVRRVILLKFLFTCESNQVAKSCSLPPLRETTHWNPPKHHSLAILSYPRAFRRWLISKTSAGLTPAAEPP